MVERVFRTWDEVGADALIGGSHRLARQRIPKVFQGIPGLVNPGDPEHVRGFREEAAGRDLVIEVGPGKGAFLCAMAARHPGTTLVGFEVRLAFAVRTLRRALRAGLGNVRVAWGDARATLPLLLDPGSVREAYLLYPDPWWKRSQAARRHGSLLGGILARVLAPGGLLVLKSDVEGYLSELIAIFLETGPFEPHPVPPDLPPTDREEKLAREGGKGGGVGPFDHLAVALIRR